MKRWVQDRASASGRIESGEESRTRRDFRRTSRVARQGSIHERQATKGDSEMKVVQ